MEDDLLAGNDTFEQMFADESLPDGGTMVREDTGALVPDASAASASQAPAPLTEDRVREVISDRMAREQAEHRAQVLERQVAEAARKATTKEPAPDFFANPNAFIRAQIDAGLQQQQQHFREQMLFNARLSANAVHTEQAVVDAAKALDEAAAKREIDPGTYNRIMNSPNPFHEAVLWNRKQSVLREVGDDPSAYRQRILDEALKDPAFQARVIAASRGQNLAAVPTPEAPRAPARSPFPKSISNAGTAASAATVARDVDPEESFRQLVAE